MQPNAAHIKETVRKVQSVYAKLDDIEHINDCAVRTQCCHFKLTGKTPVLTLGEAIVAAKGVRAAGRKALPESTDAAAGRCPLLGANDRCTIYDHRPFGCRTHFCPAAGGPYSRKSVRPLVQELESIAESFGNQEPRPFQEALTDALNFLKKVPRK